MRLPGCVAWADCFEGGYRSTAIGLRGLPQDPEPDPSLAPACGFHRHCVASTCPADMPLPASLDVYARRSTSDKEVSLQR